MQQLRYALIIAFAFFCIKVNAQTIPFLEKKITLHKTGQALSFILKELSNQAGVLFSYNPAQFNDQRKVNVNVNKVPLRLVLDELIKGTKCSYKLKKNYIIIVYNPKIKEEEPPLTLNGYIYNAKDSSLIENASIYIASGKHSAITDQYGYFTLVYPREQKNLQLSVARQNYKDTMVVIQDPSVSKLKIFLKPLISPANIDSIHPEINTDTLKQVSIDTVAINEKNRFVNFWLRLKQSRINLKNINDTLFSDFSFSLVPYLSTNKLLSINTVNKYSFNLLVGYSKGVKYFELGGLLNIDNGPVSYTQIAGIGNVVSDTVKGVQVGGIFNTVKTHVSGLQIGGVFNTAESVNGMQLSSVFNLNKRRVNGMQLGGILNIADTVKGMQLAGIVNCANNCSGMQLAGVCNYAKNMKGFQLGLINVSDTCTGIPFGLFSFVKRGYHKAELSANELQFINIGFRSGVEKFHNIFFAGANYFATKQMWTYGYGLGSTFKLKNRLHLTTELSAQQIQPMNGEGIYLSILNKAFVGLDIKCGSKFGIAFGPTYNVLVSDSKSPYYNNVAMLAPGVFYSRTDGQTNVRMWIGGNLSLKFF